MHEYGGGAYVVSGGVIYASNFTDQRIYRHRRDRRPRHSRVPVTPPGQWFYADATLDRRRRRLIAVREDHSDPEPRASQHARQHSSRWPESAGDVIASGFDFYSTPRLSPDASRLAWLAWRHPQMPWDGTELWVADVTERGTLVEATGASRAGQPSRSTNLAGRRTAQLYFVSDRDGWWKLYRSEDGPAARGGRAARRGVRPATVGLRRRLVGSGWRRPHGRVVHPVRAAGTWRCSTPRLARCPRCQTGSSRASGWRRQIRTRWSWPDPTTTPDAVVRVELATGAGRNTQAVVERSTSRPRCSRRRSRWSFRFRRRALHACVLLPAAQRALHGAGGERPPLILISHGGPTTATSATLDLKIQFWTSRGFAVADVNYGGSSGFGRAYRQRLNGQWGILDVDDMVAAARFLVAAGKADPRSPGDSRRQRGRLHDAGRADVSSRRVHRRAPATTGSATSRCSRATRTSSSHATSTRSSDRIPRRATSIDARSPIHFVDRLACPLILFQGLEDKVVPPNQSEMMAAAVRAKGLPVAYLAFEGEQHGFRKATTIVRSLEAELLFLWRGVRVHAGRPTSRPSRSTTMPVMTFSSRATAPSGSRR